MTFKAYTILRQILAAYGEVDEALADFESVEPIEPMTVGQIRQIESEVKRWRVSHHSDCESPRSGECDCTPVVVAAYQEEED